MTGRRRSGGALVLLAGLCAGLGWRNYGQWTAASRAPEPVRLAEAPSGTAGSGELPPLPAARSFEMAALSSYTEIVSRPVFSPTRRPPTAARVVGERGAGTAAVSLIGVILSADERIALIKLATGAARAVAGPRGPRFRPRRQADRRAAFAALAARGRVGRHPHSGGGDPQRRWADGPARRRRPR